MTTNATGSPTGERTSSRAPRVTGLGGLPLLVRGAKTYGEKASVDRYLTAKYYEGRISVGEYNTLLGELWSTA